MASVRTTATAAADRPWTFRAVAMLLPLLLGGAWLVTYTLAFGMAWPPELWAGVLAMASLSGLGLSLLVLPPAVPAGTWEDRQGS